MQIYPEISFQFCFQRDISILLIYSKCRVMKTQMLFLIENDRGTAVDTTIFSITLLQWLQLGLECLTTHNNH